jgi:hypothetical protein
MRHQLDSKSCQQALLDDVHAPSIARIVLLSGSRRDSCEKILWLIIVLAAICLGALTSPLLAGGAMFDPKLDDPDGEWCYAAQSTTVIGKPFVPAPVQITYDGAIYTGYAELAFFYGKKLAPVMARRKTFLEGWIPIVVYDWKDKGVDYHLNIFSAEVPELGVNNLVQFAKLTMTNHSTSPTEGLVAAAIRGSAGHFRKGAVKEGVTPDTRFVMNDRSLCRNGKLVYSFSPGAEKYVAPDVPYQEGYTAKRHHVTNRSATGFSVYRRMLEPGERFTAVFKMPRIPVENSQHSSAIQGASYQIKLAETVQYWQGLFDQAEFYVPEKRVSNSYRACLVHLMLATRSQGGKNRQGSGLPYDALFLNDYIDMLLAYDTAGLYDFSQPNIEWLLRKQHDSGMFIDVHNRGNDDIVTSHGQGLFALAYHLVMTRDEAYGRKVYSAIRKGAAFIISDHKTHNEHGLIRPSIPYDAPMLTGYHTCHNLFALLALRTSIRAARILGETTDADAWADAEVTYRQAIVKALDHIYHKEGYIRSGLYDWQAGWVQGKKGWANDYPNQDWENNLLVYPTELLDPTDPRLIKTLSEIRRRKYREGVMSYRNGMHVHQYVTLNQAQQYLAIGDQKHALLDLYHVLLHNGSTHEGFENLVEPWTNRTPVASCPPPHAWAAAKTALFIRNMMVREYGGDLGLKQGQRDLYLYSLISPSWAKSGQAMRINNAPTEMGRISSTLAFSASGAQLTVQSDFHHAPRTLALRIPYFVSLDSFESDASQSFEKDNVLYFTPDVTRATIRWSEIPRVHEDSYQNLLKAYRSEFDFIVTDGNYDPDRALQPFLLDDEKDHPAEVLSFDLVRRAFLKEYARRYDVYRLTGGTPYPVEAPKLLDATQRIAEYNEQQANDKTRK